MPKDGHLLSSGSELLVKVHTMAQLESRGGLASLLLGSIVSIVLRPICPRNVLPNSGVFPLVLDVTCCFVTVKPRHHVLWWMTLLSHPLRSWLVWSCQGCSISSSSNLGRRRDPLHGSRGALLPWLVAISTCFAFLALISWEWSTYLVRLLGRQDLGLRPTNFSAGLPEESWTCWFTR